MGTKGATSIGGAAAIASRQHGVASAAQLLDAGLTRRKISVRMDRGLLHRVHQGVYAVGHHGLSQHGRWMAAVLACDQEGRRAFLSHRSAAELWGLLSTSRGMI